MCSLETYCGSYFAKLFFLLETTLRIHSLERHPASFGRIYAGGAEIARPDIVRPDNAAPSQGWTSRDWTREFKSREVAQAPIYVIVHSLLELSFCTQLFPTPSGWLCRCVCWHWLWHYGAL